MQSYQMEGASSCNRCSARLTKVEGPCPVYWPQSRIGSDGATAMTGRVFLLGRGREFFASLTCGVEFRALTSLLCGESHIG